MIMMQEAFRPVDKENTNLMMVPLVLLIPVAIVAFVNALWWCESYPAALLLNHTMNASYYLVLLSLGLWDSCTRGRCLKGLCDCVEDAFDDGPDPFDRNSPRSRPQRDVLWPQRAPVPGQPRRMF